MLKNNSKVIFVLEARRKRLISTYIAQTKQTIKPYISCQRANENRPIEDNEQLRRELEAILNENGGNVAEKEKNDIKKLWNESMGELEDLQD